MDPCLVDDGSWTDEKHMYFLDSLESSFLHAMFGAGGGGEYSRFAGVRLDRELPDSCESTRDSRSHTRKKKTHLSKGMGIMNKPKKSIRSTTSKQHFYASNDQVVPQLEKISGDDDVEEKDHHHHHQQQQQQQTKDVGPN